MSNSFIVIGDVHLGKGLSLGKPVVGTGLNSRTLDQIQLLNWILQVAIDNHVSELFFTGDIFESPKPEFSLVKAFIQFIKDCERHEIDVHIVGGNHDFKRTGDEFYSVLDILNIAEIPNVRFYKDMETVHGNGFSVTLMPFRDRKSLGAATQEQAINYLSDKLEWELSFIPKDNKKFLIGHLSLEGSIYVGDEIDDQYNEIFCPLSMFYGYHYTLMGHVHKPQILKTKPYVSHLGSLDLSDFGEANQTKFICLIDLNQEEMVKLVPLPVRPLIDLNFVTPKNINPTDFLLQELKKFSLAKSIVRLSIKTDGVSEIARNKIEQYLYQEAKIQYLTSFSEIKETSVVPPDKTVIQNNTIEPLNAVKLWAQTNKFDSEEQKSLFLEKAKSILDKYELLRK